MQTTSIGWTERSCNPIRIKKEDGTLGGHWCKKISPGCAFCYAEALNNNSYFSFASHLQYSGNPPPLELDRSVLKSWIRARKTELVFVGTMTDIFGDWISIDWHLEIFRAAAESKLILQFLTKRPEIMLEAVRYWQKVDGIQVLPSNLWWGATIEEADYKHRINPLREINGAIHFVSLEPLLDELGFLDLEGIDWGIVGGESRSQYHPFPRPCHLEWIEHIVKQFQFWQVPIHIKQLGSNPYAGGQRLEVTGKGSKLEQLPLHLQIRQFPVVGSRGASA